MSSAFSVVASKSSVLHSSRSVVELSRLQLAASLPHRLWREADRCLRGAMVLRARSMQQEQAVRAGYHAECMFDSPRCLCVNVSVCVVTDEAHVALFLCLRTMHRN